jgi:anti-sigma B factor antagonist
MKMHITPLGERHMKVVLEGRLDTPGVDSIETRFIASLVPTASSAILDMSQVDFVSSLGIRMLVSAARSLKLRQAALAMYGVQGQVHEIFEMTALHEMIPICSTEADAQTAVGLCS